MSFVDFDSYVALHCLFVNRDDLIDCSLVGNQEKKNTICYCALNQRDRCFIS